MGVCVGAPKDFSLEGESVIEPLQEELHSLNKEIESYKIDIKERENVIKNIESELKQMELELKQIIIEKTLPTNIKERQKSIEEKNKEKEVESKNLSDTKLALKELELLVGELEKNLKDSEYFMVSPLDFNTDKEFRNRYEELLRETQKQDILVRTEEIEKLVEALSKRRPTLERLQKKLKTHQESMSSYLKEAANLGGATEESDLYKSIQEGNQAIKKLLPKIKQLTEEISDSEIRLKTSKALLSETEQLNPKLIAESLSPERAPASRLKDRFNSTQDPKSSPALPQINRNASRSFTPIIDAASKNGYKDALEEAAPPKKDNEANKAKPKKLRPS